MSNTDQFDFIIIGAGSAGIQLALSLQSNSHFNKFTIAVIEPGSKDSNDRTWCFWEKGEGPYEKILFKKWPKGTFKSNYGAIELEMADYQYKMIRSHSFYNYFKEIVKSNSDQLFLIQEEVTSVENSQVVLNSGRILQARHIFDSRIDPAFHQDEKYIHLKQHFKGWFIKSENKAFDLERFVMMDFTAKKEGTTSFMYVLPFSENEALVEWTFFNEELLPNDAYDKALESYIRVELQIKNYEILESEFGVIPMSDFPFDSANTRNLTKIGTAGGWVKPSSGYSFKISQFYIDRLIAQLKKQSSGPYNVIPKLGRWYDRIFLEVLKTNNESGDLYFHQMYSSTPAYKLFEFLDEKSSRVDELRIINSLEKQPFIKAFMRQLGKKIKE